jgi:hypothetical protein
MDCYLLMRFSAMLERRDHRARSAVRRRALALVMRFPHALSIDGVMRVLRVPASACIRLLRSFEAIGLLREAQRGLWIRRDAVMRRPVPSRLRVRG